jgi:hypothetical protein
MSGNKNARFRRWNPCSVAHPRDTFLTIFVDAIAKVF